MYVMNLVENNLKEHFGSDVKYLIDKYISNFHSIDLEHYKNNCFDKSRKFTYENLYVDLCFKHNDSYIDSGFDDLYIKAKRLTHNCRYIIAYFMMFNDNVLE